MQETDENIGFNRTTGFINCLMAKVVRSPFALPFEEVTMSRSIDLRVHSIQIKYFQCAIVNKVSNIEEIMKCANGTEGSSVLSNVAELTMKFQNPVLSVPTVVFNKVRTVLNISNFRSIFDKSSIAVAWCVFFSPLNIGV